MKPLLALIAFAVAVNASAKIPIGIVNNNPGNIRSEQWQAWEGAIGVDEYNHIIFKSSFWGLRAIRINLKAYYRRGIETPWDIAVRWGSNKASLATRIEYTKVLCKYTGKGPREKLDMKNPRVLRRIARGIVWMENGVHGVYSSEEYSRAFP